MSDVLDGIVTADMTRMEQARAVFDYVHDNIYYTGSSDKSDWEAGAYAGLTTGKGDCFTYYAVSRALLPVLEIDNLPVERVGGEARLSAMTAGAGRRKQVQKTGILLRIFYLYVTSVGATIRSAERTGLRFVLCK